MQAWRPLAGIMAFSTTACGGSDKGAEESSDPTASETSSEEPEEAYDENTWFLKAEYTSTNESGAEVDGTCEAKVTGTTDSPEVIEFTVY